MKLRKQKVLGFEVDLNVSDSHDEFNVLAKATPGTDPCHDTAVDYIVFHDMLGTVRDKAVEAIDKAAQSNPAIPRRAVVGKGPARKDGSAPDKYEKDGIYIERVKASGALTPSELQAIFQKAADETPFDPSTSTTSSNVSKKFYTIADTIIAAVTSGAATYDAFIRNFLAARPSFVFEYEDDGVTPTRDSIAAAMKHDEVETLKERQAAGLVFLKS